MTAKRFIITTNLHPSKWYDWKNRENQEEALRRRFVEFGFIMAWTTNGLDKVDPDDFWPIVKSETVRHCYKPLNAPLKTLNDAIMPTFQTYVEDYAIAKTSTPFYDDYIQNLADGEEALSFIDFCSRK